MRSMDPTRQDASAVSENVFGPQGRRKVLVTGMGRGGTSSVAAMLHHTGFNVSGEAAPRANFEDEVLRPLLIDGRIDELRHVLEDRAARYPLVAWKDPKLHGDNGLELIRRLPDDWVLVAIFRDPVAIVSRRMVSDQVDFSQSMPSVMKFMGKLHNFVAEVQKLRKVIYVSYEKVVTEPVPTIRGIYTMLGADLDEEAAAGLWARMQRSQKEYLLHSDSPSRALAV
jgi:hypothetical protein